MEIEELGKEIAKGLIATGVEGGYGSVSCSTAGDYISIGCSQWEGGRGDNLLNMIDGGTYFIGRTYSEIEASGELETLSDLLDSPQGQEAQLSLLQEDTNRYAQAVIDAGLTDARCVIYAGMWCPTSEYIVSLFIQHRIERGFDIKDNIDNLYEVFYNEYANAAGCSDYIEGYQNRAINTYNYINDLDLSEYGY